MKEFINKVRGIPAKLIAKVKDMFTHKEGKTILKLGKSVTNSGPGNAMVIMKPKSNRWTRLKRLVMFPWNFIWHGKAEL